MIHQNRADRPSRTTDVVEDTTPTIESRVGDTDEAPLPKIG